MAANKFSLFGFTISRKEDENSQAVQQSFTPPVNDDGALTITSAAYYGTYVDLDGSAKNEIELIGRYREMAMQPEIESAVDDIVNDPSLFAAVAPITLLIDAVCAVGCVIWIV